MTTTRQDSDYTYSPPSYAIEVVDTGDNELNAMAAIKAAMEMFLKDDPFARSRAADWAKKKYDLVIENTETGEIKRLHS